MTNVSIEEPKGSNVILEMFLSTSNEAIGRMQEKRGKDKTKEPYAIF